MLSDRQIREVFHLCFLERLLKQSDARLYALKGGVNLRFFFHSPRYSEDMDLDVTAVNVSTLKKNGYKILGDAAFKRGLRVYGIDEIEINDPAKAKHTETTQRFRMNLVTTAGDRLPTKVEFSRRDGELSGAVTERIDSAISQQYNKLAYPVQHYDGTAAVHQKLKALAGRAVVQARDVFDLAILDMGGHTRGIDIEQVLTEVQIRAARENVTLLSYEDFRGQVLEFLDDDARQTYGGRRQWLQFQNGVFELLGDG